MLIKTLHRLSKINRIFFHINLWINGCELSPQAKIADTVVFAHSTGVIVGGNSIIKDHCFIYAPCVIGVYKGKYPVINEYCKIGAFSLIAGDVNIERDTIIKPYSKIVR